MAGSGDGETTDPAGFASQAPQQPPVAQDCGGAEASAPSAVPAEAEAGGKSSAEPEFTGEKLPALSHDIAVELPAQQDKRAKEGVMSGKAKADLVITTRRQRAAAAAAISMHTEGKELEEALASSVAAPEEGAAAAAAAGATNTAGLNAEENAQTVPAATTPEPDPCPASSTGSVLPVKRKGLSGLKARLAKPKARRLDDSELATAAVVAQAQVAAAAAQQAELHRRAQQKDTGRSPSTAGGLAAATVDDEKPAGDSIDGTNTGIGGTDAPGALEAGRGRGRGRGRGKGRGRGRGRGRASTSVPAELGGGTNDGSAGGRTGRGRRGAGRGRRGRGRGRTGNVWALPHTGSGEAMMDAAALNQEDDTVSLAGNEQSKEAHQEAHQEDDDLDAQPATDNPDDGDPDKMGRKSYVITKQRESWSAEEHHRFMEGVEMYGRKWKEVAEHVSTRTPVQIRSHAQKYFIKLTKTGVQADIPPPRPKKKAAARGGAGQYPGIGSESVSHDNPDIGDASDADTSGTALPISNETTKILEAAQHAHAQQPGPEGAGNNQQPMPMGSTTGLEGIDMGDLRIPSQNFDTKFLSMMMMEEGSSMPAQQQVSPSMVPEGEQTSAPMLSNPNMQSPMVQQQRQSPMEQAQVQRAPRQSPMLAPGAEQQQQQPSPMLQARQASRPIPPGMMGIPQRQQMPRQMMRQQQPGLGDGRQMQPGYSMEGAAGQWQYSGGQRTSDSGGAMGMARSMQSFLPGAMPGGDGWGGGPSGMEMSAVDEMGNVTQQGTSMAGGRGMSRSMYMEGGMPFQGDMGGGGGGMSMPGGGAWGQPGNLRGSYGYAEGPRQQYSDTQGMKDAGGYMRPQGMGGLTSAIMPREAQMYSAGPRPGPGRGMMPGMTDGGEFPEQGGPAGGMSGAMYEQMLQQARSSDTGLPHGIPGMPMQTQQMRGMARQGQYGGQYGMQQMPQEMEEMYGQQQPGGMLQRDPYGSGEAGPSGSGDIYDAAAAAASGMNAWQHWGDSMQGKMMAGGGGIPGGGQRGAAPDMMDMSAMMGGYNDGGGGGGSGYGGGGGGDGWGGMQQGMPPQWALQPGSNQPGGYGMAPNMRR